MHSPIMPSSSRGQTYNNLMDITDWFPTILEMGKCEVESKNPLDGVSHFAHIWINKDLPPPRTEILHALNPIITIPPNLIDPRPWDAVRGRPFSPKMRSAIRYNEWKLITGMDAVEDHYAKTQGNRATKQLRVFLSMLIDILMHMFK